MGVTKLPQSRKNKMSRSMISVTFATCHTCRPPCLLWWELQPSSLLNNFLPSLPLVLLSRQSAWRPTYWQHQAEVEDAEQQRHLLRRYLTLKHLWSWKRKIALRESSVLQLPTRLRI